MAIEITGSTVNPNPANGGETSDVRREQGGPATPTRPPETGQSSAADTVSLTETASQLQQLESELASLPVVDTNRVEAIRQSIQSGSFEVDANRVADRLTSLESDLFSNASGQ
ncbi:MAG TPA: flagellar biosynthesis anti-sigma factor FlgM [Acidiferrobacteraceae bacterium]|nr:flagellar biosynthesis anti-sigma factor FlgM [Acidiferrobacteraceae bacterium]